MPRAPFQVLVYPYHKLPDGEFRYALLRRSDEGWWQAIAGGGEDRETPAQAAAREAFEEAGIPQDCGYLQLSTVIPIPVVHFSESHFWGEDVYVIPAYCFAVSVNSLRIELSPEHTEFRWLQYLEAQELLPYDGDRTALWELHSRLNRCGPRGLGFSGLPAAAEGGLPG